MERLLCVALGYLFGIFQTGYLYGKIVEKLDIRNFGSGNAGSTNVLRVLGVKAALVVFLGDSFKAIFCIWLVKYLFRMDPNVDLLALYSGLGVTLGHNFPFYLKFKGGKGIASMAGIMFAMDIRIAAVCLFVFSLVVYTTRYVSLGSILISITFFVLIIVFGLQGAYTVDSSHLYEMFAVQAVLMIMAIWRHRANIKRLLAGNENKVGAKKK